MLKAIALASLANGLIWVDALTRLPSLCRAIDKWHGDLSSWDRVLHALHKRDSLARPSAPEVAKAPPIQATAKR